jgi:predicted transcriptional regulator
MPDNDTIEKSNKEGIPVFSTQLDTFTVSGKLFNILKKA